MYTLTTEKSGILRYGRMENVHFAFLFRGILANFVVWECDQFVMTTQILSTFLNIVSCSLLINSCLLYKYSS